MKAPEKLVPELRFPGFEREWREAKIKDIGTVRSGSTPLRSETKYFANGTIPWVKTTDLNNSFISKTEEMVTPLAFEKTSLKLFPQNSILVAMYGGFKQIGRTGFLKVDAATNQALSVINTNHRVFSSYLLAWLNAKVDIWRRFAASSRKDPNITGSDVKAFPINYPRQLEQQKIASFLSVVDKKIKMLTREKELLEKYKKGVMQKIFSQEIRFKDENGKDFPDWEEVRLGHAAKKVTEKNKNNENSHALTNSATDGIVNQEDYFDRNIANKNNLAGYYIVSVNDFVYNPRISKNAPVGPIKRNKLCKGVMSPLYSVFRFNNSPLAYYEYFFATSLWHKYMHNIANFGARHDRMNITMNDFFKMPIPHPITKERKKIFNFLSNIDKKIQAVQTQLTQNQIFKKGLSQKMFL